jgi:hypothetical protein
MNYKKNYEVLYSSRYSLKRENLNVNYYDTPPSLTEIIYLFLQNIKLIKLKVFIDNIVIHYFNNCKYGKEVSNA